MRRFFAWSIALVLLAFGVLWPVVFSGGGSQASPADDPVVITDYKADFVVDENGRLDAVETITTNFPGDRHGLFRYWDVTNPNSPQVRQPPTIDSILLDGGRVDYQMLWEDGHRFRVAKIGDPDEYLSYGRHVFEIRYSVGGVLDPESTGAGREFASTNGEPAASGSVFYWNVIAPAWNNRIQRAEISITLPGNVPGVQCSVGYGVGAPCQNLVVNGKTVQFSAQHLAARTPVTVRASVEVPTPARAELPWGYRWDRVLGQSLTGVLWVAALTVVAGLGALLWYRTTVEPSPGFPLQYAPPPGLGPVQTEYIRTEAVPKNGLTATLFYLAERRLVELRQMSDENWRVRGVAERSAWLDVDPVSVTVGSVLKVMNPGGEFEAKKTVKSGQKLNNAKTDMAKAVEAWAFDNKLLVKRKKELWVRTANVIAFLCTLFAIFRWIFPTTMWALPFAAFFLLSIGSWTAGVGTRRTETGRELWSRAGGFHRLLTTDSAEARFDFGARKDLYSAYVPFAVAAGAAALWAKKYETTTGAPAPQPDWYNSSSPTGVGFVTGSGGANFDSFESALSSSIGAYTASQSSSSDGRAGSGVPAKTMRTAPV
ncbi:DUF2207 domain-containing protein [Mycobacterium sp. E740]|uniref:DUF2207 domain-containing protein n=1 Tax=Mycobacterium sp. E740 TaxID=1834149 RepID=UPI0007FC7581|nr:DUF2207 domain-containing protein [Mycobacterium sp. E740]OBI76051.1 hypothetical protein A5663_03660 [Mycobacterium sp. E740]